jgi:hypothetical protein
MILVGLLGVLMGCAGSPVAISRSTPEELAQLDDATLCRAIAQNIGAERARTELRRRNALTEEEWAKIARKDIGIGDRGLLLLCSAGEPTVINRTVTAYGETQQWVYRNAGVKSSYIYLTKGRISSFQQ